MDNDTGQITFSKGGSTIVEGAAVEAFRVHSLWMIVGMWHRDLRDRSIQGISQRRAIELAGEMTGKKYKPKDWKTVREDLEATWRGILKAADVVREN